MGKQRSRTTEPSAKPESGRALVLRRLRLFVVLALAAWGVVVSLALLAAMAQGHCGPDRTCGGRGYLMLGPWGIVAAIVIDGRKSRRRRQTGPVVMGFIIEALLWARRSSSPGPSSSRRFRGHGESSWESSPCWAQA